LALSAKALAEEEGASFFKAFDGFGLKPWVLPFYETVMGPPPKVPAEAILGVWAVLIFEEKAGYLTGALNCRTLLPFEPRLVATKFTIFIFIKH